MVPSKKILNWKDTINKLVVENCLTLGQFSKLTSKKVTKYLIGTRVTTEIFKLYELRFFLLKIYPLIHNLFYKARANASVEKKFQANFFLDKVLISETDQNKILPSQVKPNHKPELIKKKQRIKKNKICFRLKQTNLSPQILFATTTPAFADIIKQAAQICNMPWHQNRWCNGFMTTSMSSILQEKIANFQKNSSQNPIDHYITPKWKKNKKRYDKMGEKNNYYRQISWPSLVIIPDVSNNLMILQETKKLNLPLMGMINSQSNVEIDYPIYAQDQTLESVHFFCSFLATLIAKENVYLQHKRYVSQRSLGKSSTLTNALVSKEKRNFFFERLLPFQDLLVKLNKDTLLNRSLFFNGIKPAQKKQFSQEQIVNNLLSGVKRRTKLPGLGRHLFQFTPPTELFIYVLEIYFKLLNGYTKNPRVVPAFVKERINFSLSTWNKEQTNHTRSLISIENKNRYFKKRFTYFWTLREKQQVWKKLQAYLLVNKIINKQWTKWIFKYRYWFLKDKNYYWLALQQWHNDFKWSGHKYILDDIIINELHDDELMMTRQKIGPKWKSRLKSYINSYSYIYFNHLLKGEKETIEKWIFVMINGPLIAKENKIPTKTKFWSFYWKKFLTNHYQTEQYYKKKRKEFFRLRRIWYQS